MSKTSTYRGAATRNMMRRARRSLPTRIGKPSGPRVRRLVQTAVSVEPEITKPVRQPGESEAHFARSIALYESLLRVRDRLKKKTKRVKILK